MSDSKIHEAAERAVDRIIAGAEDTARLNWMEKRAHLNSLALTTTDHGAVLWDSKMTSPGPSLREAIDAAIAAEESAKSVKGEK